MLEKCANIMCHYSVRGAGKEEEETARHMARENPVAVSHRQKYAL